jgi:hypothetical protein
VPTADDDQYYRSDDYFKDEGQLMLSTPYELVHSPGPPPFSSMNSTSAAG